MRIVGREVNLVAVQRRPFIARIAAHLPHCSFLDRMHVSPDLPPGMRVDSVDAAVCGGKVHRAVIDQRRCLLSIHRAERERPFRD
jgi:hypothetical protein